jgi:hypothetical protein
VVKNSTVRTVQKDRSMGVAVVPLLLFMSLVLAVSLLGLTAAGHFPREHGKPSARVGALVLFGSIVVAGACLLAALVGAWRHVPWYAAIIGGGAMILFTPLVLRPLPDAFVDGPAALLVFSGLAVMLAAALVWIL